MSRSLSPNVVLACSTLSLASPSITPPASSLISVAEFVLGHVDLEHIDASPGDLRKTDASNPTLHAPAYHLIRQLRVIRIDTENMSGLCLVQCLEQCIEGPKLARDTRHLKVLPLPHLAPSHHHRHLLRV